MLLRVTTITLLLAVYIHYIEGIDRVITVCEPDFGNGGDGLISDDGDIPFTSSSGSGSGLHVYEALLTSCCIHGNCSFLSLHNALANLTSNTLINVATDVGLPSIIPLVDLANITITGHNNPTVNCNNSGGLHFVSCHNCSIKGITWDRCGAKNIKDNANISHPVLQLINSSTITIKDCSFQHSIGQAIVLSQMIGDVNISHCNFLSSNHYEGHGSAIHYSSNDISTSCLIFLIVNSNFTHNKGAKSVVYFNQLSTLVKSCEYLYLRNSNFYHNKEVPIYLSNQNLYISGNIEFNGNVAENGGGIYISDHSNVTVHKSATVKFTHNRANRNGGAIFLTNHSSIVFKEHHTIQQLYNHKLYYSVGSQHLIRSLLTVRFYNNTANKFGGNIYVCNSNIAFDDTADVKFDGDCKIGHYFSPCDGISVVHISNQSTMIFGGNSRVTFHHFTSVMYIGHSSTISFEGSTTVTFSRNYLFGNHRVMHIVDSSAITFERNSTVNFIRNHAEGNGGVICIVNSSTITFEGYSTISFIDNSSQENGRVIHIANFSTITFKGNSTVIIINNAASGKYGVIHIADSSTITFQGNSTVNFTNNFDVGVMHINHYCNITFEEITNVNFINNRAMGNGGVIYIESISNLVFGGKSAVNFINNSAFYNGDGGVMYIDHSTIIFEKYSTVNFIGNWADDNGGVMYIHGFSRTTFQENSAVKFKNNYADNGGVMYIHGHSIIRFKGNSSVNFTDNHTRNGDGGVMYIIIVKMQLIVCATTLIFEGHSSVNFIQNNAIGNNGGVMYIVYFCGITYKGNSTVKFIDNNAGGYGGVMYINEYSTRIAFEGNSTINFIDNHASGNGGVMYILYFSSIIFQENSTINFIDNYANGNGGVIHFFVSSDDSAITFKGNSIVNFIDNYANGNGGVMYIFADSSTITFEGNSTVSFIDNGADGNGGAMHIDCCSIINFKGNCTAIFNHNYANRDGGVMYFDQHSHLWFNEMSRIVFNDNTAYLGGSVWINSSAFIIGGNSHATFINNTALQDGGAIYLRDQSDLQLLDYSNVELSYNSASDYGGAIYALYNNQTSIHFHNHAYFKGNTARTRQSSVYINVDKSCDRDCFLNSITNKSDIPITTSPNRLVLYNPAKCIKGNDTDCDTYYMNNIMLGQDIRFDACLLNYYDQPTEAAQFTITGMNHQNYNISSSKYISISCNSTTQGIVVTGNLQSNNTYNYSINISLYSIRASESKVVSVNLIVELSQCHPGFWYSSANESQRCECYNIGNIISCSGSNSTIKRGYWYGSVTGTPTVATCPNDYCNFTCCEITNGIYHLSPVRANQCRPHRSGTACGSCEEGYTLSFDSPECVETKRCTVGLVLVTTLSLLYWIVVVITVFVMMYFKISFGSLYGIAYYYSIIDILLSRVLYISNGLYTTVTIISSLAKLTPQFLGQLCLVRNMSGIDQQFIHYVHPVVVFLILVVISRLARRSRKVSSLLSKGIISFICFLLLLSYTSVASTSLLLMRSLTFVGINRVYAYLSPDIEYFHGRHLAYAIVALILMITIVISFPLLLLLEPFLNSKINFIKIKPLLDQFQGCYKDKYRYFAGYYMICRLVIILLVIVKISDDFTTQYLLISSCALMQLIHLLVRPYASTILNIFDGIILQLTVIISVLPVIEFVDKYNKIFIIVIIYLLVIFPLISFIVIKGWINKNIIQIAYCKCKNIFISIASFCNKNASDDTQEPIEMREFDVIVDENMRKNAIIVDV